MDTLEEFEIYKAFKQSKKTNNSQDGGFMLNDQLKFKSNPLYDTAIGIQDALYWITVYSDSQCASNIATVYTGYKRNANTS